MCLSSWRWGTRKILHFNATAHPSAEWTLQQFRECISGEEPYKFVIHDRDSIYSCDLDSSLKPLGLTVLRTPFKSPQANAFCDRLIGSVRRECLDFMIPIHEQRIRKILKAWVHHYNGARPHSCLGPGIPEPRFPKVDLQIDRIAFRKARRQIDADTRQPSPRIQIGEDSRGMVFGRMTTVFTDRRHSVEDEGSFAARLCSNFEARHL
jgi:hypothetical protein